MVRARTVGTLAVAILAAGSWPIVLAGCQGPPDVPLSRQLRTHLEGERLQISTSIKGLPLGVREELQRLFDTPTLDIAEPGAPFRSSDAAHASTLPSRRLIAAGCSYDHCLVYYERGLTPHTRRIALIHWTPEASRLELGGIAPDDLRTIDDVRNAVLSGAIEDAAGLW